MEMLIGGGTMLVVSGLSGEWGRVSAASFTPSAITALLYLVLAGSILGFSAYKWLLANVRPALAGTYAFVNPVVAMLLGWAFAGEAMTGRLVLAMALIVGAVAMISLRRYFPKR
jgi:drug/metabolite transporter (DMT)-like permease